MTTEGTASAGQKRSRWRKIGFACAATVIGLILLEGSVSLAWIAIDLAGLWSSGQRVEVLKEETHCQYDSEIGWINKPDTVVEDHYGPGRTITINHDGVRGLENYISTSRHDRFRTICLGDSFTLGYGVDDQNTFPQMLERTAGDSLQIVNMGQGGYSVGQSYLWLKRLLGRIEPDAVVCIFIVEDFRRLTVDRTVNGYATPQFVESDGMLRILNTPVPAPLEPGSLLLQPGQLASLLSRHSSLVRAMGQFAPAATPMDYETALSTGVAILREIHQLCSRRNCPVALALTPTRSELQSLASLAEYEKVSTILLEFSASIDVPYLDVRSDFVEAGFTLDEMFLDEAFQHYSPVGNRIVADSLARWLPEAVPGFPATETGVAEP